MGLAASQARFLGLTARKSNVEYQGQQINQARTALSNEVMGLFKKYNALDVPVPPSKTDYTKTVYTLEDTYEGYTIGSFTKITEGEYKGFYDVTLECEEEIPKIYPYTAKNSVITAKKDGDSYKYLNFQLGTESYTYDADDVDNSNIKKIVIGGESGEDPEKYQGLKMIMDMHGVTEGTFYMFVRNGVPYYTSETELNDTAFQPEEGKEVYYGDYLYEYPGSETNSKTIQAKASLTQDKSGRLSTINIVKCDDDKDLEGHAYSITVSTTEDNDKYQDAMNKYNYEHDKYLKEVERINKKTEKIQTEDKALELKLNQLDTEQNALKTEMESVQKVISDTIDSVFKTYNS